MTTIGLHWRKIKGISESKTPKPNPTFLEALDALVSEYSDYFVIDSEAKLKQQEISPDSWAKHELTGEQVYTITFRTPPKYKG